MRASTLVISNIRWDFIWQRHQTIASSFAKDGPVVFLEIPGMRNVGIRDAMRILRARPRDHRGSKASQTPENLALVRPWVLPAANPGVLAWNRRILRQALEPFSSGVETVICYSPTETAHAALDLVHHRTLVYDCTDNWSAMRRVSRRLLDAEKRLMARADLTLVPSRALEVRHAHRTRRLVRLPHGALVERFLLPSPRPPRLEALSLLYYGHLHEQHFDFAAIEALARSRPNWRIRLVGPTKKHHRFPSNVAQMGAKGHEELRSVIADADALLLPYAVNEYTEAVLPAKTYECLATGRPIIAAPLPELVTGFSQHLRFASHPEEWVFVVESAVAGDSAEARAARIQLALQNTWDERYRELRDILVKLS